MKESSSVIPNSKTAAWNKGRDVATIEAEHGIRLEHGIRQDPGRIAIRINGVFRHENRIVTRKWCGDHFVYTHRRASDASIHSANKASSIRRTWAFPKRGLFH